MLNVAPKETGYRGFHHLSTKQQYLTIIVIMMAASGWLKVLLIFDRFDWKSFGALASSLTRATVPSWTPANRWMIADCDSGSGKRVNKKSGGGSRLAGWLAGRKINWKCCKGKLTSCHCWCGGLMSLNLFAQNRQSLKYNIYMYISS